MAEQKKQGGSHSKPEIKKESKPIFRKKKAEKKDTVAIPMETELESIAQQPLSTDRGPLSEEPFSPEDAATAEDAADESETNDRKGKKAAKEDTPESRERRRKSRIAIIVACAVALIIAAAATYAGYAVTVSPRNLPNLYFGDIAVGGLTREETKAALAEANWDKQAKRRTQVKLPADVTVWLRRNDSGAMFNSTQAVDMASSYGHSVNWFENLFDYIGNVFKPKDLLVMGRVIDEEYIRQRLQTGVDEFKAATAESGYVIEEEGSSLNEAQEGGDTEGGAMLYMMKGGGQLELDMEALYAATERALIAGDGELEYKTFISLPEMPDFKAIHTELERDPVDAYYTETFEVVQDVVGCRFDVSEAEKIWTEAEYAQPIEIPLDITYPQVRGEALEAQLYRDVLGTQTTYFPNSSDNRINNLNQAINKINGIILLPGETFSYNETIGQRTEAAGFLPAGAYENGEVVEQIGGGVCQVSSTLYSATLYAQMKTVDRTCHVFAVDYLDKGMDATVSWPKPDFKFQNSREFPIKIVAACDNEGRSLTVSILGTDVDGSYMKIRRDTFTVFGEYGEAIGITIQQYRDIYAADGTFLRTEAYDYMDVYYLHGYQEITAKAKAASEAAAAAAAAAEAAGGGEAAGGESSGGGEDYGGVF